MKHSKIIRRPGTYGILTALAITAASGASSAIGAEQSAPITAQQRAAENIDYIVQQCRTASSQAQRCDQELKPAVQHEVDSNPGLASQQMRFLLRNNIVMRIDSALADQGKPYTFMVSLKTPHQYSLSFPPGSINPELARPLQTAIREYTERQTALSQKIDTCVQNPSASLAQTLGKPKIEPDFVCSADEGRKARARATEGQALMQKNLGN